MRVSVLTSHHLTTDNGLITYSPVGLGLLIGIGVGVLGIGLVMTVGSPAVFLMGRGASPLRRGGEWSSSTAVSNTTGRGFEWRSTFFG